MTRDLLLFLRAPLAATAVMNLCLGLALARPAGELAPRYWGAIALLALASACLLWAGMGLNDLFDLERDRALHPQRPLPSGRLPLGLARLAGWGFLAAGVGLEGLASYVAVGSPLWGLVGATCVAICILSYDGWLKRWRIPGALAMGSCRASNALAGAYALGWWSPVEGWTEALPLYAAILGGYVAALTFLSTYEEETARPAPLTLGYTALAAAPGVLIALCLMNSSWRPFGLVGGVPLFGVVLAQWIMAILEGTRARGEAPTMAFLKALWLLDLGVLAGRLPTGWHWVLGLGCALWVANKLGARRLFRPPPAPTRPPAAEAALDASLPEVAPASLEDGGAPAAVAVASAAEAGVDLAEAPAAAEGETKPAPSATMGDAAPGAAPGGEA